MKVLRCPECGTDETHLYVEQEACIAYTVTANPDDCDGVSLSNEQISGFDSYRMGCNECGGANEFGDPNFTDDFLLEVDDAAEA